MKHTSLDGGLPGNLWSRSQYRLCLRKVSICVGIPEKYYNFSAHSQASLEPPRQRLANVDQGCTHLYVKEAHLPTVGYRLFGTRSLSRETGSCMQHRGCRYGLSPPTNVTELMSLLGQFNVYRRYASNFVVFGFPSTGMLGNRNPMKLETVKSDTLLKINTLKEKLTKPPMSALPRFDFPYTLGIEACDRQIRYVLVKTCPDNSKLQLEHCSRSLKTVRDVVTQCSENA